MVCKFKKQKTRDAALCPTFCEDLSSWASAQRSSNDFELRLKYAQSGKLKWVEMPAFSRFFLFELKLKWFVGSRSTKHATRRYALRFARIYRVERRLKEAQMILSFGPNKFKVVSSNGLKCLRFPRFFIFELKLKWFVGSRSTKQTTRRYALRFARIHRVELRLKEAQMILSSGSNRLKVVTQVFPLRFPSARRSWWRRRAAG